MIDQLLKFFVTFLVVVEPIGVIPIFVAMTIGDTEAARRRMARKGVAIAGLIFLLFALGGGAFLRTMNISLDAFRIFGGLLLFLIALEMVFARPSGSRTSQTEEQEGMQRTDISVFPLAFPFIPGRRPPYGLRRAADLRVRGIGMRATDAVPGFAHHEADGRDRRPGAQPPVRRGVGRACRTVRHRWPARQPRKLAPGAFSGLGALA
jgi:hypothetical protein